MILKEYLRKEATGQERGRAAVNFPISTERCVKSDSLSASVPTGAVTGASNR